MKKLLNYTDRGLGCIVSLLGILATLVIVYAIYNALAEAWSYLAYHFNYVLIIAIIAGLSYMYYAHPSLKFKENDQEQGRIRILLSVIGFLVIWFIYSFPQFFR